MKLLLDTHTFLWFILGNSNLSSNARALVEDQANEKFLSVASLWEIAIKVSIGKLALSDSFNTLIPQQLSVNGFELLGLEVNHAAALINLPFHHRDPFDRLLIAQAIVEQMQIVSIDSIFDSYQIIRLW
jgi:PIN domain nuclease of toxin-antitoxin system